MLILKAAPYWTGMCGLATLLFNFVQETTTCRGGRNQWFSFKFRRIVLISNKIIYAVYYSLMIINRYFVQPSIFCVFKHFCVRLRETRSKGGRDIVCIHSHVMYRGFNMHTVIAHLYTLLRRHPITITPEAAITLLRAALPSSLKRRLQQRLIALLGFREPFLCQSRQRLACADEGSKPARERRC